MLTFAEPCAPEIEPQNWKSKIIQGFHGMKDDLIVQRAPKYRMGMTNQGGMGGVGSSRVEQSFEASGGAFEKQGSYGCGFGSTDLRL